MSRHEGEWPPALVRLRERREASVADAPTWSEVAARIRRRPPRLHRGVSCDSCLKSNFGGRRYKCLICYDYDLCASCYESGAAGSRHTAEHPMQCILTRSDFELYYGGEVLGVEQPQAYTCPFCNRMGFTDVTLQEHVTNEHSEMSKEVVCPVCAAAPGGEPNLVTDDFAGHLTLEHRAGPRDLISFLDEPSAIRHGGVRRIPHSGRGGTRARRSNMHFGTSGGLSALSPSSRDAVVDPIAELLSQLSGVRRPLSHSSQAPSQLQQLQMQLQLERQQATAARQQQLDRLPRRQAAALTGNSNNAQPTAAPATVPSVPHPAPDVPSVSSQFLLSRFLNSSPSEEEQAAAEEEMRERAAFVQSIIVGSLVEGAPPPATAPPPPVQPQARPNPRATKSRTPPCKCRPPAPHQRKELKSAPEPPRASHLPEGR